MIVSVTLSFDGSMFGSFDSESSSTVRFWSRHDEAKLLVCSLGACEASVCVSERAPGERRRRGRSIVRSVLSGDHREQEQEEVTRGA